MNGLITSPESLASSQACLAPFVQQKFGTELVSAANLHISSSSPGSSGSYIVLTITGSTGY
ncbi:hypothetical protein TYRP_022457 [Tyrophagus putrescentiae]|nr:hypothetical protein TYRP_022457 [Tyrophagus putrescentiae]